MNVFGSRNIQLQFISPNNIIKASCFCCRHFHLPKCDSMKTLQRSKANRLSQGLQGIQNLSQSQKVLPGPLSVKLLPVFAKVILSEAVLCLK